ncbi:MAG: ATP-dependent Clp protease proteolytic subunit, partial [Pseudomonadota bacterium]|nr:ATP-dependent Clp protease proteolytic subunit [Pseudomonadota bacterium]
FCYPISLLIGLSTSLASPLAMPAQAEQASPTQEITPNDTPTPRSKLAQLVQLSDEIEDSIESLTTLPKEKLAKQAQSDSDNEKIQALQQQLELLKLKNTQLMLQNLINAEKYKMELTQLEQEKDRLALKNELQNEKNRQALSELTAEKEKLVLENELQTAKQTQVVAELEALKKRLELKNQINEQEQKVLLTQLDNEHQKIAMQNALLEEKNKQQELEIQLKTAQLNLEMSQLELEKAKKTVEIELLSEKITAREQKEIWDNQVNEPQPYLKEPFIDGHLVISDRRIELDTLIVPGVSEYIIERLSFFNNKDEQYPIFLIIDRCYGGSVMEGANIVEAMQNSQAPVYVVVKSLAASMAAVIAALAERSYAYPNAQIVHHQMSSFAFGNQRQLEEQLDITQEWSQRLLKPVAEKMGLSLETFVEKMYAHNSSGNWREFADSAVKLNWINTLIEDIRDKSYIKKPVELESEPLEESSELLTQERHDRQGQLYREIPYLGPLDFYFLYNPDNYYRLPSLAE